jgi:prolyl oligopeptidase PreP (S9A serine peptidase family)
MPDAVVDYNLSNGKWTIVQQQNLLYERTKILYGTAFASPTRENRTIDNNSSVDSSAEGSNVWNDLLDYYECQYYYAESKDKEISVPLTVVYSKKHKKEEAGPGLLHGHGAYGEVMDQRWRSELKSLLDRGWVMAFADVRLTSFFFEN